MSETFQFQAEINQLMSLIINAFYSNKDIFLRELISNCSDALDKVKFNSLEHKEILEVKPEMEIKISFDKDNNKLIIEDSGIGMNREDLINCLGTIANSGTKNFIKNMNKDNAKDINLIGQFGVGFYSAYLVADKVKVTSKVYNDDQYIWESDASGSYTITKDVNNDLIRGTRIELFMKDDAKEYMDVDRCKDIIKKHSQYISYPIRVETEKTKEEEIEVEESSEVKNEDNSEVKNEENSELKQSTEMEGIKTENDEVIIEDEKKESPKKKTEKITTHYKEFEQVNDQLPLWVRPSSEITTEEYQKFYRSMTGDYGDCLTYKHFSTEGALNFKSILFIPSCAPMNLFHMDRKRKDIKLYVKRVFITDDCEELVPQWLGFIKGVVDSEDIPLNVSRELLQQNKYMKMIKKNIVKKSIEMMEQLTENKDDYFKFYLSFGKNLKLGIHEDHQYEDKLIELLRFTTSTSDGNYISLKEYVDHVKSKYGVKKCKCECKSEECKSEECKDCDKCECKCKRESKDCENCECKSGECEIELEDKYKKIYYIVGENMEAVKASPFIQGFAKKGLEVVFMTDPIDEYMMTVVKKYHDFNFVCITNNTLDLSEFEDEKQETPKCDKLVEFFKTTLKDKIKDVVVSKRLVESPCVLITDSWGWSANMERIMKSQVLGDNQMAQFMVSSKTLEINVDHPIMKEINNRLEKNNVDRLEDIATLLYQGALLASGFVLDKPQEFVSKLNKMIQAGITSDDLDEADVPEVTPEITNEVTSPEDSPMESVD